MRNPDDRPLPGPLNTSMFGVCNPHALNPAHVVELYLRCFRSVEYLQPHVLTAQAIRDALVWE